MAAMEKLHEGSTSRPFPVDVAITSLVSKF